MLDVLTPAGQATVAQEREAVEIFRRHNPEFDFVGTPKHLPADVDGLIACRGEVRAVVEVKCRQMTFQNLKEEFAWKWLITFDKLDRARKCAVSHRVPLTGWLLLLPERTLLTQRICEPDGMFSVPIEVVTSVTQRTVNGGTATRSNALIPMQTARVWR